VTQPPQPILVPLDGSSAAENALPLALALAKPYSAPVELVQVIDLDSYDLSPAEQIDAAERFEQYVQPLVASHGGDSAVCKAAVIFGKPAAALIDLAGRSRLVVMASHGRGGFQATFVGSVTDKVVRGAPVPVLVVPAIGEPSPVPSHILVAIDGSEQSEAALEFARELAAAFGARLTLVHAYVETLPPSPELATYQVTMLDALREAAEQYANAIVRDGESTIITYGRPADVVLQAAGETGAGLVVMASSGKGLAGRLLLGSTTQRVLHALHRPLLIIPPARDGD
jgi:nucleotide-binding universal stress UspA family protein